MQRSATEIDSIWSEVRDDLRQTLPQSAFEQWLSPLEPVGVQGSRLYVSGPVRVRDWFKRRYGLAASEALRRHAPEFTEIAFTDPPTGTPAQPFAEARGRPAVPEALRRGHSFDNFVIGPGNRMAHAAALAVAESPGESYNPLFMYGSPGLGKTHLLVSIANYMREQHPDLDVVYTTAERFTSEFVTALRGGGDASTLFKERYREVGALLIDDVQFLEGKARTEEEFFHTFNELYAQGSQIVLSSDRPPEALGKLSERLRDRFAWGLAVELQAPDARTKLTLLELLAERYGLQSADVSVLERIAAAAPGNLRKLEGALTRVSALASLLGESPSAELVRKALGDPPSPTESAPLADGHPRSSTAEQVTEIQNAVCRVLHVSVADMRSPRRAVNVVRARQLAMYTARKRTDLSLSEIAGCFERDHSTVLHSIRRIERDLEPGSDNQLALERIYAELGGS